MTRTLDRYVIREILPPFALTLLIFTFLLVLPPVMDHLENLLAKGVDWATAARILWTLVPQALGLTIPMSLLVGILIGLGRLSADREAVALLACGVSPYRLLRPVGVLAAAATAATLYVMVVAIPDANQTFRDITFDIIGKRVATEVRPRVFYEDFPGWVLYPRDEAPPGEPGWRQLMVADTSSKPGTTSIYFAERGRLVLERSTRTVDLVLENGTRFSTTKPGETETYRFPGSMTLALNPDSVFPQVGTPMQRGPNEKRIPELLEGAAEKVKNGMSPHPEIIALQQKFSIPVACLVFAVIGLALGLSVAREGKMAGFVVGIAVIFAYYIVLFLAESHTKGFYAAPEAIAGGRFLNAHLSRWWPNIILGIFGVAALIWRARYTEARLPVRLPVQIARVPLRWRPTAAADTASRAGGPPRAAARPKNVRVVIRIPRFRLPAPGLLDRYISRAYTRIAGLSFLALLGLFYISTFIDRSDKIFKGQAAASTVGSLLIYSTPQFVYYIIPIATLLSVLITFGMLSRSSELTVMKACGISLYRTAASVVLLSLGFSVVIFQLEQHVLARANRRAEIIDAKIKGRQPRVFQSTNRRWVAGRSGDIYHYRLFDPDRRELAGLTIYHPRSDAWTLDAMTYAERVSFRHEWKATDGWRQDFSVEPPKWKPFEARRLSELEPPDYFASEQPDPSMMTVGQLRRTVEELAASGLNVIPMSVELHHKMAFPFVTLVMTLLAVPFGVSTGKRGALYAIGLGIVMALSYWIVTSLFVALGKGGLLTPWLAGWAPNIIVLGSALYLFLTVRT
jgi:LPS export ABC transporter permease LptG/LPS export ABC transporter permease LptF